MQTMKLSVDLGRTAATGSHFCAGGGGEEGHRRYQPSRWGDWTGDQGTEAGGGGGTEYQHTLPGQVGRPESSPAPVVLSEPQLLQLRNGGSAGSEPVTACTGPWGGSPWWMRLGWNVTTLHPQKPRDYISPGVPNGGGQSVCLKPRATHEVLWRTQRGYFLYTLNSFEGCRFTKTVTKSLVL